MVVALFTLKWKPLYVGNLILGGADSLEIAKVAIVISLIAGTPGRPYGIFPDWVQVRHSLEHSLVQSHLMEEDINAFSI